MGPWYYQTHTFGCKAVSHKIRRRRTPRIAIERSETYLNGIETKNGVSSLVNCEVSNADNSGINSKGNLLNAEAVRAVAVRAVADKAVRAETDREAKVEEVVVVAKVAVEGVAVWVGM